MLSSFSFRWFFFSYFLWVYSHSVCVCVFFSSFTSLLCSLASSAYVYACFYFFSSDKIVPLSFVVVIALFFIFTLILFSFCSCQSKSRCVFIHNLFFSLFLCSSGVFFAFRMHRSVIRWLFESFFFFAQKCLRRKRKRRNKCQKLLFCVFLSEFYATIWTIFFSQHFVTTRIPKRT